MFSVVQYGIAPVICPGNDVPAVQREIEPAIYPGNDVNDNGIVYQKLTL